jgi:hypothetical protein
VFISDTNCVAEAQGKPPNKVISAVVGLTANEFPLGAVIENSPGADG